MDTSYALSISDIRDFGFSLPLFPTLCCSYYLETLSMFWFSEMCKKKNFLINSISLFQFKLDDKCDFKRIA